MPGVCSNRKRARVDSHSTEDEMYDLKEIQTVNGALQSLSSIQQQLSESVSRLFQELQSVKTELVDEKKKVKVLDEAYDTALAEKASLLDQVLFVAAERDRMANIIRDLVSVIDVKTQENEELQERLDKVQD